LSEMSEKIVLKIIKNEGLLSHTMIPEKLLHREAQIQAIKSRLEGFPENMANFLLTITGDVGQGKTAAMNNIEKGLRKKSQKGLAIHVPVKESEDPYTLLRDISRACGFTSGPEKLPDRGISYSEGWLKFSTALGDTPLVVVLDDFDLGMMNVERSIEPLIRDLASRPHTGIICISNNLAVIDLIKDDRIHSRISNIHSIDFPNYTPAQLVDILKERVDMGAVYVSNITPGALELCAALAVTGRRGDARYALAILLQAAKLAEQENTRLTRNHIERASTEFEQQLLENTIRKMPTVQKFMLYTVATKGSCALGEMYRETEQLMDRVGEVWTRSPRRRSEHISNLEARGFVQVVSQGRGRGGGVGWTASLTKTYDINRSLLVSVIKKVILKESGKYEEPGIGEPPKSVENLLRIPP